MKVHEIMTRHPVCCWPSSSTLSAALLMQESDTGILPVIQDAFTPVLVGVVTDRDLCLRVVAGGRDPASTWVDACMTPDPVCCGQSDDLSRALELMKSSQLRRIPVVNERHEITGMLSLTDVVRHSAITPGEMATVLRQICEPKHVPERSMERLITAA